ncbi:MAG TPA: ABC-type transport auxiliary lipoprotein family protein [Azospira sp.]|nr:ABC-type transport auxiliary lipoprotein family protein [Azospira sp.]
MTPFRPRLPLLAALLALTLAACAGGHGLPPPSTYDFGPGPQAGTAPVPLSLDLRLAPWLDSPALHYRLAYEDASRLAAYGQSRWAAPVGQLLNLRLRQQLGSGAGGSCLLKVEVDEFTQVFDAPQRSRGVLQGRMTLLDKQRKLLSERSISVEKPAPSADARGGVVALTQAVDAVGMEGGRWLADLEREAKLASCR